MAREKPNSSSSKRIKARDRRHPNGYFTVKKPNTIRAARLHQIQYLMNAVQSHSIQNDTTSLPQNDTTAIASYHGMDMSDHLKASNTNTPTVAAIPEPSSNASTRKRALMDETGTPTTSIASEDIEGTTSMRTNVAASEKRHKVSKPRTEAATVFNVANNDTDKVEPLLAKTRINMTTSYKVSDTSSKSQNNVSLTRGPKHTNTAIATENSIEDVPKAAGDAETVVLPVTRTFRSHRVTKKVFVTKDFIAKRQVKPVKRSFRRPQRIADTEETRIATDVIVAIKRETDWFSGILGATVPGFHHVLPFFMVFNFDPEIDAKILKGLKASAIDQDLKGIAGAEDIEEPEDEDDDDGNDNQFQSSKFSKNYVIWSGLDLSLPPLHSLPDIFEDIVSKGLEMKLEKESGLTKYKSLQLKDFVDYVRGRKLRIGTMCSGTECPVLALRMINDALTRKGSNTISFDHVLSCEIEPFKQAYIQRNFDPEFLFRDVTELPQLRASTAYGSPVDVPGNLDMLIAGSSCKDYSGLNNKKKTFEEDGQSRSTFQGVLGYAKYYTPRIVILENVQGAPWPKVQGAWDDIGYETFVCKVDTKDYYIPQTRQRGYMVGFNREIARIAGFHVTDAAKDWSTSFENYARRASSPFTNFIYSEDDPRLHQVRRELSISQSLEKPRKKVDWIKSRQRYISFRAAYGLGFRKPLTMWENNGTCKFPDGSWLNWAKSQVERVWDTLDGNFLRCVSQRDYDLQYKIRHVELSQNIDRDNDTRPWGIIGCITPCGIPYLTKQLRPIIGQESLALQGIPGDSLSLAYETSRQLQDFAGNAMTSTVVGTAMLAAFGVGHKILERGSGAHETPSRTRDIPLNELILNGAGQNLTKHPLPVGPISSKTFEEMRSLASCTTQLCSCEGRYDCKRGTFQGCSHCGHKTCTTCGQNPLHGYEPIPAAVCEQRKDPSEFEGAIREWLPLQFCFGDVDYAPLSNLAPGVEGSTETKTLTAIRHALENAVHLTSFSRTESWTAIYESSYARLEIVFARKWHGQSHSSETLAGFLGAVIVQCYLYAKARAQEPANSSVRVNLNQPIARMTCNNSSKLEGNWEIRVPKRVAFELKVEYLGERVDSWEKRLGLNDTMFSHRQVSKYLRLCCSTDRQEVCPKGILGFYELLQDCGTACGSLYRKLDDIDLGSGLGPEPVFFFLDPGDLQNATEDSFVFATNHHQPILYGARDVIAEVKKGWRPALDLPSTSEILSCKVFGLWHSMRNTRLLVPKHGMCIQRWLPISGPPVNIDLGRCTEPAFTALVCSFPLREDQHKQWIPGNVYHIDLIDKANALQPFTQLVQRASHDCGSTSWIRIMHSNSALTLCKTCAPTKPRLVYQKGQSKAMAKHLKSNADKPILVEDQRQSFTFEKQIRARPSPVVADLHCHEDGNGTLKVQLNVATLIHRAYAKILSQLSNGDPISSIQWRLAVDSGFEQLLPFPQLSLLSNETDREANLPPKWKQNRKLHSAQLRSLHWMQEQESRQATPWIEQETEEARIPSADLRLEARVECERRIRGGVLADEVGYGKTAITLALFDSDASGSDGSQCFPEPAFVKGDRKIKIKATLILAPAELVDQWHSEVKRFLKPGYDVLLIKSEKALMAATFERITEADLILSTWEVFGGTYFGELAYFGRSPQLPKKYGRAFQQWLGGALENTDTLVERSDGCEPKKLWPALQTMAVINSGHQATDPLTSTTGKTPKKKLSKGMKATVESQFKLVDMQERKNLKIVPLLHFFSFRRIVTDEFTYVKEKHLAATLQLTAPRKWILSGTPPLGSFRDINNMAMFLGTKLSTDDNDGGVYESQAALKEKMQDKTEAEKFHFYSYQTLHSTAWYHDRHKLAEKFAAQFIRQNPPDLTKVQLSIHYEIVNLSAAERATYFELFQLLMNRPMSFSIKDKKDQSPNRGGTDQRDRTKRLLEMASGSRSPEEALLICCSTPMSTVNGVKENERTASIVCRAIVAEQKKHLCTTVQDLIEKLVKVFELWELGHKDDATVIPHFHCYIRSLYNNEFGDEVAKAFLERVMAYAQATAVETAVKSKLIPLVASSAARPEVAAGSIDMSPDKPANNDDGNREAATEKKNRQPDLRKLAARKRFIYTTAAHLTNLSFRVTEHLRGLRFFNIIQGYLDAGLKPHCSDCLAEATDAEKTLIMGLCGHASCTACFEKKHAQRKLLDECVAAGCEAPAHPHSAFRLSDLDRDTAHLKHPFGSKIDAVLKLLLDRAHIGKGDLVVIFVQFERLKAALIEGLQAAHITYQDGTHKGSVEMFKKGEDKVCILDPESVNAAGWNLQLANHVIFLSSLTVDTQYNYTSMMTQACGRVYRQGQEKNVHIYHFLAARTMDVNILQDRTGKTLVQRNGEYLLLPQAEVQEGDKQGFAGAPFEGAASKFED